MKQVCAVILSVVLLTYAMPLSVLAGGPPSIFSLPDGVAGTAYRASIPDLLRDTYRLKLESNARASVFRWTVAQGELPPGLTVRANGSVVGVPRNARVDPYTFQLRVFDISSPGSAALTLDFSMMISAPRVRLAHINTPRLVPTDSTSASAKTAPEEEDNNAPLSVSDRRADSNARTNWNAENTYASMLRKKADAEPNLTTEAIHVSAAPVPAASCATACEPTPAANPKNDFIIDAITGATSGKTKFKRTDRTRIIIKNKNPFLYEYRVSIEDKAVEEPALASLEELFGSIGKGTFPKADANDTNKASDAQNKAADVNPAAQSCPIMNDVHKANRELLRDEGELGDKVGKWTDDFNAVDKRGDDLKTRLVTAGAQCPALCSDANSLVEDLRGYLTNTKSSFDELVKEANQFEKDANGFSAIVDTLVDKNAACAQEIKIAHLEQLAEHHLEFAQKLTGELNKLKEGRKKFDTAAKSVEKALTTANAFYEVIEKGDFNEATDVNIKIERKDITKDKSEFASLIQTKLNFGGGPRFTLGGGLVASLLERPEYERVSTVVNGQVVNIVGLKRTSSGRVLPLLMLHTRIGDIRRGPIDGIHFSVGATAKPNSEGTSAEFLFGPSLSFAQGKMFFTAGGYMGKKQELQGSFALGSQIPSDFGAELPIAEHYVWKPGFAITYKIK